MSQMSNLAISVSDIVNDYIARGMAAEEVCGALAGVSFRVMQASTLPETDSVGGGSPVSVKDIVNLTKEDK